MSFPESEDQMLRSIFNAFGAFGGIDGCHTPIKRPHSGNEASKEYYNFKNFYSIGSLVLFMMGVVAADYRFLWANVGLPGSVNDACTFQVSHLYSNIVRGDALSDMKSFNCTESKKSTTTSNFDRRLCFLSSFLAAKTIC